MTITRRTIKQDLIASVEAHIREFLSARTVPSLGKCRMSKLLKSYADWCDIKRVKPQHSNMVGRVLLRLGYLPSRCRKYRYCLTLVLFGDELEHMRAFLEARCVPGGRALRSEMYAAYVGWGGTFGPKRYGRILTSLGSVRDGQYRTGWRLK